MEVFHEEGVVTTPGAGPPSKGDFAAEDGAELAGAAELDDLLGTNAATALRAAPRAK